MVWAKRFFGDRQRTLVKRLGFGIATLKAIEQTKIDQDYTDFDHFLAGFASHKRKKIRHERRIVAEAGVNLEVRAGGEMTPALWDVFYNFYHLTIRKHGAIPYLTREFFHELGRVMPENIVMIFAGMA